MGDNLKWFKVWTSITDDPDFLEMSLEDIARWVLLGAYIRKHGISGKIIISDNILAHLLRCEKEEINVTIAKLHNVQKNKNNGNDKNIVTFKNWHKYQIDDSSQRVSKFRQNVTMQDKIREDKIKIRKDKREESKTSPKKNVSKMSEEEWLESLKVNKAYEGLDIGIIYGKMLAWCEIKGGKPTRARLLNWLNREEKPMTGKAASKPTTSAGIAIEYLRKKAMREEGTKNAEAGHGEVIDISVNSISESKDLAKRTGF